MNCLFDSIVSTHRLVWMLRMGADSSPGKFYAKSTASNASAGAGWRAQAHKTWSRLGLRCRYHQQPWGRGEAQHQRRRPRQPTTRTLGWLDKASDPTGRRTSDQKPRWILDSEIQKTEVEMGRSSCEQTSRRPMGCSFSSMGSTNLFWWSRFKGTSTTRQTKYAMGRPVHIVCKRTLQQTCCVVRLGNGQELLVKQPRSIRQVRYGLKEAVSINMCFSTLPDFPLLFSIGTTSHLPWLLQQSNIFQMCGTRREVWSVKEVTSHNSNKLSIFKKLFKLIVFQPVGSVLKESCGNLAVNEVLPNLFAGCQSPEAYQTVVNKWRRYWPGAGTWSNSSCITGCLGPSWYTFHSKFKCTFTIYVYTYICIYIYIYV